MCVCGGGGGGGHTRKYLSGVNCHQFVSGKNYVHLLSLKCSSSVYLAASE